MKILFIASHCDDLEICCGGTIARLLEEKNNVTIITLSHIYAGVDLKHEWLNSMEVFKPSMYIPYDFPTRGFSERRQDILELLFKLSKGNYDSVFTHSPTDLHQDHSVVGQESVRAFKNTNLFTYQGEWNSRNFIRNYFVRLEARHIQKKADAIACFHSQKHRNYTHPDYTWANALNTGVICNSKYAESYQAINIIV